MNCIGIDVGKQELVAYDGKEHHVFPNTPDLKKLKKFISSKGKDLILVFEPTSTYSRYIESFCMEEKIPCCMPNPRIVPHLREVEEKRSKTDFSDSQLLYIYGIEKKKSKIIKRDGLACSLSSIMSLYKVTQKNRVACQGLKEALSKDPMADLNILLDLKEEIERLKTKEKELLRRAHDLVKSGEDQGQALRSLESIPGIGTVTAIILICLFRKYENTSRSEIVSLVGVDPVRKESGISVRGKSRISKRGSAEVRKRLYEATLSAARFNPAVKELYQRLKKRGKAEKAARIAAARKLLIIAHAVYKKQEMYLKSEMLEG